MKEQGLGKTTKAKKKSHRQGQHKVEPTCSQGANPSVGMEASGSAATTAPHADSIPRGFWVTLQPYAPDLAQIEAAPFLAVEIVDFQHYLSEGKKREGMYAEKLACIASSSEMNRLGLGDALHISQSTFGDMRSGLRKQFLDRPDTPEEIELYGRRHPKTGELMSTTARVAQELGKTFIIVSVFLILVVCGYWSNYVSSCKSIYCSCGIL